MVSINKLFKTTSYSVRLYAVVVFFALANFYSFGRVTKNKDEGDIFIRTELSKKDPFEGEALIVTYRLYSPTTEISFARRVSEESFSGDEVYKSRLEGGEKWRREEIGGKEYFSYPVEKYVMSYPKGKQHLNGVTFEIGVNKSVVYEDPFWGRRRGYETVVESIDVKPTDFKVKPLPKDEMSIENSGAVGKFSISSHIPPGDIFQDRSARVIITLKGHGILDGKILPMYREAFDGEKVKLKSMSEDRKMYFDGRGLISEVTLDCEFIPLNDEAEIGKIRFRFFNPDQGRYEEVESEPIKVKVKSSVLRLNPVEV